MTGHYPAGAGSTPARSRRCGAPPGSASISATGEQVARARSPSVAAQRVEHPLDAGQLLLGERLARPAPQHGAQLVLDVEGDPVVDAVAVPVRHRQHVAALAVGVVDHDVEDRHPPQGVGVLVDQRRSARSCSSRPSKTCRKPAGTRPSGHQVDGVLRRGRAPATAAPCRDRAGPRAGSSAARRPSRSASRHDVRRHLAAGERAVREVPQRPLAARPACRRTARRRSRRRTWRWRRA